MNLVEEFLEKTKVHEPNSIKGWTKLYNRMHNVGLLTAAERDKLVAEAVERNPTPDLVR